MPDINEHDEFLLSELLDGNLPAPEAQQLRERMSAEPALRETYETLERVHSLVDSRRSDQPSVDWGLFHQQVMNQVHAEQNRSSRVIRFPRWATIGVPLAAAAAIAFVVLINRTPAPMSPPKSGPIEVIVTGPNSGNEQGELMVIIDRPGMPAEPPTAVIDVAFTQSVEMDELIRQLDEERRSQPPSYVSKFLQTPEPEPTIVPMIEEPPL